MQFSVLILGSNAAVPAYDRHPTAQMLRYGSNSYLIDCGEGTQMQMSRYKASRGNLDHIFISHLHGDHYFGLIGLINSMVLNGRTRPLHIHGPKRLQEVIQLQIEVTGKKEIAYPLIFHTVDQSVFQKIWENDQLEVFSIPLKHKLICNGFLFREKPLERSMIKSKIEEFNIPYDQIRSIKQGDDFKMPDGSVILNKELTSNPKASRSYAFCSDTAYDEDVAEYVKDVDLLYHEATFLEEHAEKAIQTQHSTTKEAATIAKKANAKQLLIGHFSSRYDNLDSMADEARTVFPNTHLAIEGETFEILH